MEIDAFKLDEPLILTPHPNGGWTVAQWSYEPGRSGALLGAYSSVDDMLDALTEALSNKEADS